MAFKKVEKFSRLIEFENPGDFFEGTLVKITRGRTQYGDAEFLQICDNETGEMVSVALGAALQGFDWNDYIGLLIRIEYLGEEKSKNHKGKKFKKFDLFIDDGE